MKINHIITDEIMSKNLIFLLIITGITFSVTSFFILDDQIRETFSTTSEFPVSINICENGLCNFNKIESGHNPTFIQLEDKFSNSQKVQKNEEFTNLKLIKNVQKKSPEITGNKVTLFAEKDSFIREVTENSNDGSNPVLRIMGTGPTNNRVLISFNTDDIKNISSEKTLKSATLNLYIESNNHNWGDGQFVNIHRSEVDWEEGNQISTPVNNLLISSNGVSWRCPLEQNECVNQWNGGKYKQTPTDSIWITNQVADYWVKFDVTPDILDFLSSEKNFGWILIKSDENSEGQINISSKESSSNIPELVMVFSDD